MKIKVEKVNEFDFKKESLYYVATITVKVGNLVKGLIFSYRENNKEGERLSIDDSSLSELKDGGMEFDHTELVEEYLETRKVIAQVKRKNDEAKAKEFYNNHWAVKVQAPKGLPKSVTFNVNFTLEEYISAKLSTGFDDIRLLLEYKGRSVEIRFDDVSGWKSYQEKWRYSFESDISDYKRRNYIKINSAISKAVELIDAKLVAIENDKNEKIATVNRMNETVNLLTEKFAKNGWEVKTKMRWVSGYSGQGGYETREYRVEKDKRSLLIDNYIREEKQFFNLGSFLKITEDQVNQMLAIF